MLTTLAHPYSPGERQCIQASTWQFAACLQTKGSTNVIVICHAGRGNRSFAAIKPTKLLEAGNDQDPVPSAHHHECTFSRTAMLPSKVTIVGKRFTASPRRSSLLPAEKHRRVTSVLCPAPPHVFERTPSLKSKTCFPLAAVAIVRSERMLRPFEVG